MDSKSSDLTVTELLAAAAGGQQQDIDRLWDRVYRELRRMARHQMLAEPRAQDLQPTALVHEAFLRLVGANQGNWENRRHFFAAAAEAMRRIRVDYARTRKSLKRGGQTARVDLLAEPAASETEWSDLLAVNDALEKLTHCDPKRAEVVKLRYFGGLTVQETADVLGVSPRTVDNYWRVARTWLHRELAQIHEIAIPGGSDGQTDDSPDQRLV